MRSFWWLAPIALVLACGGAATLAPAPVAQLEPAPTNVVRQADAVQVQTPTPVAATNTARAAAAAIATIDSTLFPTATVPALKGPVVRIGGAELLADFPVELALTAAEQIQGLSGRPSLTADTGMLFVYEKQSRRSFWMPDMHFPLDIVWIGSDCAVADVTLNALPPEPGQANQDLPLYSPKLPAQYVLEINAGEAEAKGISEGVGVEFLGDLAGRFGC